MKSGIVVTSVEEAVARASELSPALRERSIQSREGRRVADATIGDYIESGLHKLARPAGNGGWDLGAVATVAVASALGRGDAGQAWALTSLGEAAHAASAFGEAARRDIWGDDDDALLAGTLLSHGTAQVTPEGITISGRWPAVAGIDHASWLLGGVTLGSGEEASAALFLVPKAEARIVDDGSVAGLEGAGGKSFVLQDAAVPAHRVANGTALAGRHGSLALAAVPLGAVSSMIESFVGQCQDTVRRGRRVADNFATALRISESSAEIDAAMLALEDAAGRTMAAVKANETLASALNCLRSAHAVMLATRAADRIFAAAGAKAIMRINPMQYYLQDVHAIAAQQLFFWDSAASAYGLGVIGRAA